MSEDRSTLAPFDPDRNALMPSTGIPGDVFNPLFPNQTPPARPLAPTGASPAQWSPTFRGQVDWAGEDAGFKQSFENLMNKAPQWVRDQVSIESGYRPAQQQAEIYARSHQGQSFMAAAPWSSWHQYGRAADLSFKTPEAKKWFYDNVADSGLRFPFPEHDSGHIQLASVPTSAADLHVGWVPGSLKRPIVDAALANGLDPAMFAAMIEQESSFNPNAKTGDAAGLGQLRPDTAKGLGVTDPYNVNQNLMGSARYLRQQLDNPRSGGDIRNALMMYNGGPNANFNDPDVSSYPDRVMARYQSGTGRQYAQASTPAPATPAPTLTSFGGTAGIPGLAGAQSGPRGVPGPQIASAGTSDAGPMGEPKQGQPGQQLPGLSQSGMPQALTSGQMMALLFSMSAQRVQARPISYDPWSIERAAIEGTNTRFPQSAMQMSPVGGLGLSPYTTRVGRTVPGPA